MATLPAGTLLGNGRYRVLKEVNRGGTAVVYECETIPTGEHVACKVRRGGRLCAVGGTGAWRGPSSMAS